MPTMRHMHIYTYTYTFIFVKVIIDFLPRRKTSMLEEREQKMKPPVNGLHNKQLQVSQHDAGDKRQKRMQIQPLMTRLH